MERKPHWEKIYAERKPEGVSWYQKEPALSLRLVKAAGVGPDAGVIDAGGGASTLVDRLLSEGFTNLSVLDISGKALATARTRLGARGRKVRWIEADVLDAELAAAAYDLWHDRAVFHFLTDPADRARYLAQLRRALRPQGHVIIAAFSPAGPPKCSGLEVARYSAETLSRELGAGFRLAESLAQTHQTPFGTFQEFVYCRFRLI